jgi:hypothetical protein
VAVGMGNDSYAVIFALSNIVTNFLLLFCMYFILKMEKGYATKIDDASLVSVEL